MSIFKKLMTAFRGGVREVGESIVDANGVRIFEQEIADSKAALDKAKHNLTGVMAKRMQVQREIDRIEREITEHENYAAQALEKGEESLALEIAEKIAGLEADLNEQKEVHKSFDGHVSRLKEQIKKAERNVKEYERQLAMVKTTDSVQKATAAVSENFSSSNSNILSAKASLDRIKARQQEREDRLSAAQELSEEATDKGLHDKLEAAGIKQGNGSKANDVLARLKAKQSKAE